MLEQLYYADVRYFTFYNADHIENVTESYLLTNNVYLAGDWINNSRKQAINDVKNSDAVNEAMLCDIDKALTILKRKEKVDYPLGIIIGYGSIVDYVLHTMRSIEATYRFF